MAEAYFLDHPVETNPETNAKANGGERTSSLCYQFALRLHGKRQ